MKKTIKINISGIVFNVDEDAFEQLSKYLKSIERHFSHSEEGKEIISDIEARVAELFRECLSETKEVINVADVSKVISILGEPEEIADEEEPQEKKRTQRRSSSTGRGKRLYRDTDNSILGGVCSGIAEYFRIDPVIVRVIFVVTFLAYFVGFIIYLILWIAVPAAVSTAQKLEMKGETINVSNIEKKIREEYEHVKENFRNIPKSKYYRKSSNIFVDFFHGLGKVIQVFLKFLLIIFGASFIILGVTVLVGLFGGFFFSSEWLSGHFWGADTFTINSFLYKFADPAEVNLAMVGLALFIGIPVLALIYGGIKLIFRFRANTKVVGTAAFTFWLVGLGMLIYVGVSEGKQFSSFTKVYENQEIREFTSNTVYIELGEFQEVEGKTYEYYSPDFDAFDDFRIISVDDGELFFGKPRFDIEPSYTDQPELVIEKRSRGINRYVAQENAKVLEYSITQKDSLLVFDPYFIIPKDKKWRDQSLRITLKLPKGMNVHFDESMHEILNYIYDNNNNLVRRFGNKTYKMGSEGLSLIEE